MCSRLRLQKLYLRMRIAIATDSFKGSLTSLEAAEAIKAGIKGACRECEVFICPIADGGEGTVRALVTARGGIFRAAEVEGPLGRTIMAEWGIIDGNTAVIEMASAAGITLLGREQYDPVHASTYGVGQLIRNAINEGIRSFIIGLGGSATNDGGAGMLEALGYEFLDEAGNCIPRGAEGLKVLARISCDNVVPELKECSFRLLCDVKNPLCGPNGCSKIFGPQKGATEEQIADMDSWLQHYADVAGGDSGAVSTGAAGGLGFAFQTFLGAVPERGIDVITDASGLEKVISESDIVITGEGRIDAQTVMGKAPYGVATIAKKYNKKVIAFCGVMSDDADICYEKGIDMICPTYRNGVVTSSMLEKENASAALTDAARTMMEELI